MGKRSKKSRKIEQWTLDVFPNFERTLPKLVKLSLRDCAILVSASIDVALVEVLSKRLVGPGSAITEFLGGDEDGRAPCASFGSRIQLALLLGLMSEEDAKLLRTLKKLRNMVAHRVNIDVTSPSIQKLL